MLRTQRAKGKHAESRILGTITGTQTATYNLTDPGQNPATVATSGLILVDSGVPQTSGIHGTSSYAWTVANFGTVASVGEQGIGISLDGGGLVVNGTSGTLAGLTSAIAIAGGASSTGTIV